MYQHIFEKVKGCSKIDPNLVRRIKTNQEMLLELINYTMFLEDDSTVSCRLWCLKNKIDKQPVCKNCGKNLKFKNNSFSSFCGYKCIHEFENKNLVLKEKRITNQKNSNLVIDENGQNGYQRGIKKLWENLKKSPDAEEKIKNMRVKTRETKKKNGTFVDERLRATRTRKQKTLSTLKSKFRLLNEDTFLNEHHIDLETECLKCGNFFTMSSGRIEKDYLCQQCHPNTRSSIEKIVSEILQNLNISFVCNKRKILDNKLELDFFCPEKNLGIEVNGDYYHSEKFITETYHQEKMELCNSKNITLLQFFENELKHKREICESIIRNKVGLSLFKIDARKCKIEKISSESSRDFFNKNHISGFCAATIYKGLIYQDELVALISFRKPRFNRKYDWEIIRYATKLNTNVRGGFSKLISSFIKDFPDDAIITYADLRYGTGNVYEKSGASFISKTKPNYWYIYNNKMYSRYDFQKKNLKTIIGDIFDESLSERQNALNAGASRTWDCGCNVFGFNLKTDK